MTEDLLNIQNLSVHFKTGNGVFTAVDTINFSVAKGETLLNEKEETS